MNELQTRQIDEEIQYELMKKQAAAFYQSGMFSDIKSHAQALVKVMAGKEMGIPPFASMTGINLIHGKPTPGANLIASQIANHSHYNYRLLKINKELCEIAFYDSKDRKESSLLGISSFTMQEAQEAGLLTKKDSTWLKYPTDLLFARAMTRGARRFCPGIFGGTVFYTPEELGVEIDENGVILQDSNIKVIPDSDEAIIEEIKLSKHISEDFR